MGNTFCHLALVSHLIWKVTSRTKLCTALVLSWEQYTKQNIKDICKVSVSIRDRHLNYHATAKQWTGAHWLIINTWKRWMNNLILNFFICFIKKPAWFLYIVWLNFLVFVASLHHSCLNLVCCYEKQFF